MAVIKLKKRKEANEDETPKLKKLRIKTKVKKEPDAKPKLNVSLRKSGSSNRVKGADKGSGMKLKLNLKKNSETEKVRKTPRLRLKPIRVPGEGYDSEASDVEDDPLIEEGIILRVLPDIQAEFVKHSIESGDYSGISIKWKGQRHAVVNINDVSYGAVLMNLPTIIEVNKSVDRKNLLKTIDVSQMLLCVQVIENEEEVFMLQPPDAEDLVSKHFEEYRDEINEVKKKTLKGYNDGPLTELETKYLEQIAVKPYDYRHGITPPLYNVRNRRFRRKMGLDEFDYVEHAVERLLKQDDQAEEINYELVDEDEIQRRSASATNLSHFEEEQLGSLFSQGTEGDEKEEDDLDLDAAFQSDTEEVREGVSVKTEKDQASEEGLFDDAGDEVEQYNGEEDEEDEEEEEEEEEEEGEADEDDGEANNGGVGKKSVDEDRQHNELLKDELHELETTLNHAKQKLQKATNPLLKSRFIESIKKLEKEVELKRKQLKVSDETLLKSDEGTMSSQNLGSEPGEVRDPPQEEDDDDEDEGEEEEEEEEEEDEEEEEEEVRNGELNQEKGGPEPELDQNDLDMMMLFGGEGDDAED